jgi:hypothetical protein
MPESTATNAASYTTQWDIIMMHSEKLRFRVIQAGRAQVGISGYGSFEGNRASYIGVSGRSGPRTENPDGLWTSCYQPCSEYLAFEIGGDHRSMMGEGFGTT